MASDSRQNHKKASPRLAVPPPTTPPAFLSEPTDFITTYLARYHGYGAGLATH